MVRVTVASLNVSVLFASISIVSGFTLAILVAYEQRRTNNNNSMASFNRHLDALSDESRAHLRQQVRAAQDRQNKK